MFTIPSSKLLLQFWDWPIIIVVVNSYHA